LSEKIAKIGYLMDLMEPEIKIGFGSANRWIGPKKKYAAVWQNDKKQMTTASYGVGR